MAVSLSVSYVNCSSENVESRDLQGGSRMAGDPQERSTDTQVLRSSLAVS